MKYDSFQSRFSLFHSLFPAATATVTYLEEQRQSSGLGFSVCFYLMIPFLNLFFVVFLKTIYTERLSILFCEEMRPSFSLLNYILLNSAEHFLVNCPGKKTGTQWIDSIYDVAIYCCIWKKCFSSVLQPSFYRVVN